MSGGANPSSVVLKVSEASSRDAGKGLARMDPKDMEGLGASVGDIVKVHGKRTTAAKVMPAYPEDRGKKAVKIDGLIRHNADVGIGEKVELELSSARPAVRIILVPAVGSRVFSQQRDTRYVGKLLNDLPVVSGDLVRATLFGSRFQDFIVSDTSPDGVVLIRPETAIRIEAEAGGKLEKARISYEDIGGLEKPIQRVREMIELPLRHPQLFERLGIDPPKGVLLHGPPGCGKTLLARAVANETEAAFFSVSGPEVIHKFYGESIMGEEPVLVLKDGHFERRPIADIVADRDFSLQVPCFGPDGKMQFGLVTGFHKHPFRGKLVRVRTATGRSISVTDDHSLFTLDSDGIKSVNTSELEVKHSFIAVPKYLPLAPEPLGELNLLSLLKDDDDLAVRGPYVEQTVRQAIDALGRKQCAAILGVHVGHIYHVLNQHLGIRLPRFLRLSKAVDVVIEPGKLTLTKAGGRKSVPAIMALSKDLCDFFGLWLAEGSYSKNRSVRLSVHLDEANRVADLCARLFGKVAIYRKKNAKAASVHVSSTALVKAMRALGFVGGARQKSVPAFVYNLSRSNLAALLRGYISGDGSVNNTTPAPQVEISTASAALADDLCHLLLLFGIVPKVYDRTIHKHKRICFADSENLTRFMEIGFHDPDKNATISRYLATDPVPRRDGIPLSAVKEHLGWRGNPWENLSRIGVAAAKKRAESLPVLLAPALDGDIFWDRVTAIEELPDTPDFVYDISVEPAENFIAGFGGIFAHNSEAKLRDIFDQAKQKAPSIIFIDEIDSIAPKRENVVGDVEKRVVAQLLALLDGMRDRGQIVVVAATNLPNLLDPALRRPGRLDREIVIGIPDSPARLQILEIHTRGMPLAEDVDLKKMAEITHGFTGADLEALSREAAMIALRKIIPQIDFALEMIPYELLADLEVTMDNFREALKEVEPSGIREVFTEVPNVRWTDVGGLEEIKRELQEAVEWPIKHTDVFKHTNMSPSKGILIHGSPGTGKTLLAKAVATESQANFISIKGPELMSKWVGESEKGVREVFKKAKQSSPCVLFLDELDALAPSRSSSSDSHVSERVISQLLTEMDGIEELRGVIVLAATNRLDLIDSALLRPGRFDLLLEMPAPDEPTRLEIFNIHTRGKPIGDDVHLTQLAQMTEGCVGADIEFICRRASMLAIREFIQIQEKEESKDYSKLKIRMSHFQAAMQIPEKCEAI